VLKSDAAKDLVAAVEALQAGTTFFNSRIGEMVLRAYLGKGRGGSERVPDLSSLTSRERGMVQLLAEGKSTKEAAFLLNLGVKTAERQRSNIMRKLGLHSMSELVLYAVRNHIIQVQPGPR
jgi:DNA-binding NarL/FixJ family response regulator